jgi:transcriptional regulator with XRE-family HTH domain
VSPSPIRTRKVIVVDNSHVARRVGERIKQARTRAGLTQAQVAQGRYTAAYISALERGLAKPSMAALTFLSERLGVSVPDLVAEERPAAGRLEADLLLASGAYTDALDRYDALLEERCAALQMAAG